LVQLGAIGKQGYRGLAECALELALREVAEAPLGQLPGFGPVAVERFDRVAGDQEARPVDLFRRGDRVTETLVGANSAEAEKRAAVVCARRFAREHRVRNHPRVDPELQERLPAALAVHDDAVEAGEQLSPERLLPRGPARHEVVGRENRRQARP